MKTDVIIAFVDEVMNQYVYNSDPSNDWLELDAEKKKEWLRNFYDSYIGVKMKIENGKECEELPSFNKRMLKDMVALLDGLVNEFYHTVCKCNEWDSMSYDEKKNWCMKFASDHARKLYGDQIEQEYEPEAELEAEEEQPNIDNDRIYEIIEELYNINDAYYSTVAALEDIKNGISIISVIDIKAYYSSGVPNTTKISLTKDILQSVLKTLDKEYTSKIKSLISEARSIMGE